MADFSHSNEGVCVLVRLVRVEVVEGGWVSGRLVAGSEVYPHGEVDLTATHDIV